MVLMYVEPNHCNIFKENPARQGKLSKMTQNLLNFFEAIKFLSSH